MKIRLRIDNKETGKQCAAISTGLVLGALAQLLLEPEKIQAVLLTIALIGAVAWYAIAQLFFTREIKISKKKWRM